MDATTSVDGPGPACLMGGDPAHGQGKHEARHPDRHEPGTTEPSTSNGRVTRTWWPSKAGRHHQHQAGRGGVDALEESAAEEAVVMMGPGFRHRTLPGSRSGPPNGAPEAIEVLRMAAFEEGFASPYPACCFRWRGMVSDGSARRSPRRKTRFDNCRHCRRQQMSTSSPPCDKSGQTRRCCPGPTCRRPCCSPGCARDPVGQHHVGGAAGETITQAAVVASSGGRKLSANAGSGIDEVSGPNSRANPRRPDSRSQ